MCLLSDFPDLQFLHGIAGNDDCEPGLVAEEESEELLPYRNPADGSDTVILRLLADADL